MDVRNTRLLAFLLVGIVSCSPDRPLTPLSVAPVGAVRGLVVERRTGRPVAGAMVHELVPPDAAQGPPAHTITDEQGWFTIEPRYPGARLRVLYIGYRPATVVPSTGRAEVVTVPLEIAPIEVTNCVFDLVPKSAAPSASTAPQEGIVRPHN